jgi:asparagine synthase (glutamine-hydrolysing)
MSDIFIASGRCTDASAAAKRLTWTPHTKCWLHESPELTWIITRVDDPILWSPSHDKTSGVRAFLGGRIAPEESEWKAAEALPYWGGLACRIVIDRWLKGGAAAVERLNGGVQIIVIDEKKRDLHVWTDRMGFYPAFAWTGDSAFLLCSHPDVAASALEAAGRPCQFDPVTMAEFLRTGTSVHPNTYWHGIRHMDAGTRFHFKYGDAPRLIESATYWRPTYLEGKPYLTDRREIVDRLATALKSAVQRRTLPRLGKVGVLLSAGADSRTALFGACDPSAVTCYTFYDEPNAELNSTRRLAGIANAKHVSLSRTKDYYLDHADPAVRVSGGMWTAESAHHTGFSSRIAADGLGTLLTGCYADYMLKGITYDRRNLKIFGRYLPLHDFAPFNFEWHHPHYRLAPKWNAQVDDRLQHKYVGLTPSTDHDRSLIEHLRLNQIIREPDASGRLFLRRTLPVDFFMSDNAVVELFGSICPDEKLNAIPFGMAVARITGREGDRVLNNNFGAPVGAAEWQRVAAFVSASLKRKITGRGGGQPYERDPNSVATVGSWPNYSRVIELSPHAKVWRANLPADHADFVFDLLGAERRGWSINQWSIHSSLFFRAYTAALWLSQQPRALARMRVREDAAS